MENNINNGVQINTRKYLEKFVTIQDINSEIVPFTLNEPQEIIYAKIRELSMEKKPIRLIILKARQQGISTLTEGILFKITATEPNTKTGIITHRADATKNLFEMTKGFYNRLPSELQPELKASNAQELVFNTKDGQGLNSLFTCMTASDDGVGRSATFKNLHMSEFAYWQGDKSGTFATLMASVPDIPNSIVIIESTANGYDEFRNLWVKSVEGTSGFVPIFIGWNKTKRYRAEYDGFELTQTELDLQKKYNLSLEQISWRRHKINQFNGNLDLFHRDFPICPEEAFVASGNCVFDSEQINKRLSIIKKPLYQGIFEYKEEDKNINNITWKNIKNGYINIYKLPEQGRPYVIAGDTAGEGSDYFTAQVLDNISGEQVATLKFKLDEGVYARQIYCLATYYNTGLLGVETNYGTYAQIKLSEEWKYKKLYIREKQDDYTQRLEKKYGFRTTTITRPTIVNRLIDIMSENIHLINDYATLQEMLTFIRDENGKATAMQGTHDDLVMALAIAYELRASGQQKFTLEKSKEKEEVDDWVQRSIKEKLREESRSILEW